MINREKTSGCNIVLYCLCGLVGLLALLILLGWMTHSTALLQLTPGFSPVTFNTTLSLILLSFSLAFLTRYPKVGLVLAAVAILLTIGSVMGFDFDWYSKRAGLTTSACIILSTACLYLIYFSKRHKGLLLLATLFIAISLALSWTALFSHVIDLELTYGWQVWSQLSFFGGVLFLVLGCAFLIKIYNEIRMSNIREWGFFAMLIGFSIIGTTLIFAENVYSLEYKQIQKELNAYTKSFSAEAKDTIQSTATVLNNTRDHWQSTKHVSLDDWTDDLESITMHQPNIAGILWQDTEKKVLWSKATSDYASFKKITGGNEGKFTADYLKAKTQRTAVITAPFLFNDNMKVQLIIEPIYKDEQFSGYLVGVIKTQQILEKIADREPYKQYQIKIYKNNKLFFESNKGGGRTLQPSVRNFTVYNAKWTVSVTPSITLTEESTTSLPMLLIISGVIFSILVSVLIYLLSIVKIRSERIEQSANVLKKEVVHQKITEHELRASEKQLKQEALEIGILHDAMRIATEKKSLDVLLQELLDLLCERTGWPIGHIYKINYESEQLFSSDIWHINTGEDIREFQEATRVTCFKKGEGLPGRVWNTSKTTWIPNVKTDDNFPRKALCENLSVQGAVGFPLFASGKLIAIFEFFATDIIPRDEDLIKMFDILSQQISSPFELKEAEARNRLLLDSAGEGIYGLDLSGNTTFVNPAAARMLSYGVDELIGQPMHRLVHHSYPDGKPYDRENCPMCAGFTDGKVHHITNEVLWRKDGTSFPVEYTSMPVREEGEITGAVVTFNDITEQKKSEKEILEYADKVAKSNAELDKFAYITSHDLKAPLRAIQNLTTWIEEDSGKSLSEESKKHFDMMKRRVQRMNDLIEGILNYSRIGRMDVDISEVNVRQMLTDVIDSLAPPKTFKINISENMPTFKTPNIALSQVFSNLISNAIKYMGKTDGVIDIEVTDTGDYYEFSVKDNGPGIDPKNHERIFGLFQTLHARDQIESTGVGLTIIQKMVEWLGGTVWLDSELGKGTTFYFTWPKHPIIVESEEEGAKE